MNIKYTRHTLGTACLHLMGVKLGRLCSTPVSLLTREDIYRAIRIFQDECPGYMTKSPGVILRKALGLLREARKKGFEYVPLSMTSGIFRPAETTMNTFPGVFVGTCDMDAFRESLRRHTVAVVGTRDPSPHGIAYTKDIVEKEIKECTLVTGFALGIQEIAIQAALAKGMPVIAIAATGVGDCYPSMMHSVLARLTQTPGCAVVTPYFPGEAPMALNFLLRNHLVALADETIVVESKAKGGAMVTARLAAMFGRHVEAVPGRPDDPRSKGCNQLIHEGTATLRL